MGREWSSVKDTPWWYNERALVSLFAGAVWRCGGDAFEEFSNEKRRSRKIGNGRIDLWFTVGKGEFNAEAKQSWLYSDQEKRSRSLIAEARANAVADANRCIPDGRTRLAMIFAIGLVPKKPRADLDEQIARLVTLSHEIKADATAWVFPALAKLLTSTDGYILPGITLWIWKLRGGPRK